MQMGIITQETNIPVRAAHFLSSAAIWRAVLPVYLTNPRFQNNGHSRAGPFVKGIRAICSTATDVYVVGVWSARSLEWFVSESCEINHRWVKKKSPYVIRSRTLLNSSSSWPADNRNSRSLHDQARQPMPVMYRRGAVSGFRISVLWMRRLTKISYSLDHVSLSKCEVW